MCFISRVKLIDLIFIEIALTKTKKMETTINRRKFIKKSAQIGAASCVLMMSSRLAVAFSLDKIISDENIDPQKLNFCGYVCPVDCNFHIATIENDIEKKKEAFQIWNIKERYGVDFNPETSVCWKCKNTEKTEGVVVKNCTVRSCAMDKGYNACIECNNLNHCVKDLWSRFPEFHKTVIEMQVKYNE
jgi:hypothetical protein